MVVSLNQANNNQNYTVGVTQSSSGLSDRTACKLQIASVAGVGVVAFTALGVLTTFLIHHMTKIRVQLNPQPLSTLARAALTVMSFSAAASAVLPSLLMSVVVSAAFMELDDEQSNEEVSHEEVSQPFVKLSLTNGRINLDVNAVQSFGRWFAQESTYSKFFYQETKEKFGAQFLSDVLEAAEDAQKGESMGIRFEENGNIVVTVSSYMFYLALHRIVQETVLETDFSGIVHRQNCFDVQ